jgi:mRNA-degrading endonuclease RelE of RelBE toxin-antitoxin system
MCEVVDSRFSASEEDQAGEPEELREARQALQTKAREVRKLQKELASLHRELDQREKFPRPPTSSAAPPRNHPSGRAGIPAVLPRAKDLPAGRMAIPPRPENPPASTVSASLEKPVVLDPDLNAMRERVASLKSLLRERHSERNQLRRELELAKTQIESFRQKPPVAPDAAEEAEEHLLGAGTLEGKQPVRLPEFPRKFHESISALPPSVARACLGLAGRLAGGDPSAFTGVKRLKSLPNVYRARVSEDYRLLFRLHSERLEILDLINRRDLERKIRAMM